MQFYLITSFNALKKPFKNPQNSLFKTQKLRIWRRRREPRKVVSIVTTLNVYFLYYFSRVLQRACMYNIDVICRFWQQRLFIVHFFSISNPYIVPKKNLFQACHCRCEGSVLIIVSLCWVRRESTHPLLNLTNFHIFRIFFPLLLMPVDQISSPTETSLTVRDATDKWLDIKQLATTNPIYFIWIRCFFFYIWSLNFCLWRWNILMLVGYNLFLCALLLLLFWLKWLEFFFLFFFNSGDKLMVIMGNNALFNGAVELMISRALDGHFKERPLFRLKLGFLRVPNLSPYGP